MHILVIVLLVLAGTGLVFTNIYAQEILLSPLKQVQSGISPQDVKCKDGLVLVIRPESESPACTNPSTATRLIAYGWITPEKFASMHPNSGHVQPKLGVPVNVIPNYTSIRNDTNDTKIVKIKTNVVNNVGGNITNSSSETKPSLPYNSSQVPYTWVSPLPSIQVTPAISSTGPNSIKILAIGVSPYPLKVGDQPKFTLTYQNISDKPFYIHFGCTQTPLSQSISPSDSVMLFPSSRERAPTCADRVAPLDQNEINTSTAWPEFMPGFYQITKPGTIHVVLTLYTYQGYMGDGTSIETIKFDLNAT